MSERSDLTAAIERVAHELWTETTGNDEQELRDVIARHLSPLFEELDKVLAANAKLRTDTTDMEAELRASTETIWNLTRHVSKQNRLITECRHLSSRAAMECGADPEALLFRLAAIEKVCKRNSPNLGDTP